MKENEIDVVDKLALPELSAIKINELPEYLGVIKQRLNSYMDELKQYEKELDKKIIEVTVMSKLKEAVNRIFYKYPNAKYIACIERACTEDDSGNCRWQDRVVLSAQFPDLDFEGIDYSSDSDTDADCRELSMLFRQVYPNLTFEGGDNAYWDSRPDQYYGLNRECEPVFISEYDEDGYSDSDPVFEVLEY